MIAITLPLKRQISRLDHDNHSVVNITMGKMDLSHNCKSNKNSDRQTHCKSNSSFSNPGGADSITDIYNIINGISYKGCQRSADAIKRTIIIIRHILNNNISHLSRSYTSQEEWQCTTLKRLRRKVWVWERWLSDKMTHERWGTYYGTKGFICHFFTHDITMCQSFLRTYRSKRFLLSWTHRHRADNHETTELKVQIAAEDPRSKRCYSDTR